MKGITRMTRDMGREKKHGQLEILIQVNFMKTIDKDRESKNGKMDECMKGNGKMIRRRVSEY